MSLNKGSRTSSAPATAGKAQEEEAAPPAAWKILPRVCLQRSQSLCAFPTSFWHHLCQLCGFGSDPSSLCALASQPVARAVFAPVLSPQFPPQALCTCHSPCWKGASHIWIFPGTPPSPLSGHTSGVSGASRPRGLSTALSLSCHPVLFSPEHSLRSACSPLC